MSLKSTKKTTVNDKLLSDQEKRYGGISRKIDYLGVLMTLCC